MSWEKGQCCPALTRVCPRTLSLSLEVGVLQISILRTSCNAPPKTLSLLCECCAPCSRWSRLTLPAGTCNQEGDKQGILDANLNR